MEKSVTKFASLGGMFISPWGHEFKSKEEVDAFNQGMDQVIDSSELQNDFLKEKAGRIEQVAAGKKRPV
tara:strand:+ start:19492 stop:19698 length:207 start_codon:yes stop_codon:yes gene_type:complete